MKKQFAAIISTWFYLGKIKFMPGTFGSIGAFPLWLGINYAMSNFDFSPAFFTIFWIVFLVILFFIGAKAATIYSRSIKKSDPGEIVIDEVVGQIITLFISSYFLGDKLFLHLILSLMLFRYFDIAKPLIIKSSEKWFKEGYGIMIDDVLAGIFAGLSIILIFYFF